MQDATQAGTETLLAMLRDLVFAAARRRQGAACLLPAVCGYLQHTLHPWQPGLPPFNSVCVPRPLIPTQARDEGKTRPHIILRNLTTKPGQARARRARLGPLARPVHLPPLVPAFPA